MQHFVCEAIFQGKQFLNESKLNESGFFQCKQFFNASNFFNEIKFSMLIVFSMKAIFQ
jgi:hypothetical protein